MNTIKITNLIILNDIVFKSLFKRVPEFRDMIDDILKYYFDVSIKGYKLHSEEIPIHNKKDHSNRMDIFLKDEDNKHFIDIESNLGSKSEFLDYYMNRNLVYAAKLIIWAYNDEKYEEKYCAIQINFNDIENPFNDSESSSLMLYDVKNKRKDDRLTIHNLYLGKYKKLSYNELNELERDLKMLISNDINEMENLACGNTRRQKVMSEYKKLVSDEEFFNILFDPEREIRDRAMKKIAMKEGREEGRKEGRNEEKIKIAKNALKMNMSIDDIQKLTSLSIEEIKKIND